MGCHGSYNLSYNNLTGIINNYFNSFNNSFNFYHFVFDIETAGLIILEQMGDGESKSTKIR